MKKMLYYPPHTEAFVLVAKGKLLAASLNNSGSTVDDTGEESEWGDY